MEKKRGDFVMSEEKFEENSTPQDYGAPQDYSAPDTSYSNAGSQAETPVTPVTENGPQTESWQNQGGWQQPQQPEFQNQGSFQNQGNFQSQGNYQGQPDFTGQGSAQNYNTAPGAGSNGWQQQYTNPQAQQQKQEPGKGFAIASMILGIVSLVLFCTCINVPLAIAAIILAIVQFVKNGKNGMAIAGMITGILSIVLCIVFWVLISVNAIDESITNGYSFPEYWEEEFQSDFDDSF